MKYSKVWPSGSVWLLSLYTATFTKWIFVPKYIVHVHIDRKFDEQMNGKYCEPGKDEQFWQSHVAVWGPKLISCLNNWSELSFTVYRKCKYFRATEVNLYALVSLCIYSFRFVSSRRLIVFFFCFTFICNCSR